MGLRAARDRSAAATASPRSVLMRLARALGWRRYAIDSGITCMPPVRCCSDLPPPAGASRDSSARVHPGQPLASGSRRHDEVDPFRSADAGLPMEELPTADNTPLSRLRRVNRLGT